MVLAGALFYFAEHWRDEDSEPAVSITGLTLSYAGANDEYFGGKLPKNVTITLDETNSGFMASTMVHSDGTFWIQFNPKYTAAERVANITLLHEMCHIKVWPQTHDDMFADDHGPLWRGCMLSLDAQGAFRQQIIDGYREKTP